LLTWAHDDGASLVVATHELSSVTASERLIALRDGSVIFDGDPADADPDSLSDGVFDHVDNDFSGTAPAPNDSEEPTD
jgi:energy-coupling factor transporter ATP-binding protein EcfA2